MLLNDVKYFSRNCKCDECKLHLQCNTNSKIPGRFAEDSITDINDIKMIIVGEAPGKHEDEKGFCFAHTSGKILKEALGNDFKYCYLTNICRCTPYADESKKSVRAPSKDEMECCKSWILEEISNFSSKIPIVLCGNTALSLFFPDCGKISDCIGTEKKITFPDGKERTFIPNFHPASIVYNNSYKQKFFDVFKEVRSKVSEKYVRDPNTKIIQVSDSFSYIDSVIESYRAKEIDYVVLDLETTSLSPNEGEVVMIGLCETKTKIGITIPLIINNNVHEFWENPTMNIPFPDPTKADISKLKAKTRELFSIVPIVGHNIKFDIKYASYHDFMDVNNVKVYNDTLTLMSVLIGRDNEFTSLALKPSASKILGVKEWNDETEEYLKGFTRVADRSFGNIPTCLLYKYCGRDVYYTMLLHEALIKLKASRSKNDSSIIIDSLNRCTEIFSKSELSGISIDYDMFDFVSKNSDDILNKLLNKIKEIPEIQEIMKFRYEEAIENNKKAKKPVDESVIREKFENGEFFSPSSPLDKKLFLCDICKVKFNIKTPKGDVSFSKEGIEDILKNNQDNKSVVEFCNLILQYNKFSKIKSTYIDGLSKNIWDDNKLHVEFNINGTVTGRMSSYFHTMPGKSDVKRFFNSRWASEGGLFSASDMSQLELRITAAISSESAWINAYKDGQDLHQLTASRMFDIPFDQVTKDQRKIGKIENFALLYGSSAKSQAETLGISLKEAEDLLNKYKKSIPNVISLIEYQKSFAKKNGYIWNMFNRYMPIPGINDSNQGIKGHAERASFNYLIQSSASDCVTSAISEFNQELKDRRMKSQLIGAVHDSVEFDIYPGEAIQFFILQNYFFSKRLSEKFSWVKCPMDIDMGVGVSWGSCLEMKNFSYTDSSISFNAKCKKKDILKLSKVANLAYNFSYEIIEKRNIDPNEYSIIDLIKDNEEWKVAINISEK